METERKRNNVLQQCNCVRVQFVEDLGLVRSHFGAVTSPSMKLPHGAERPFRMLVARADHSRSVCARWRVEFFFLSKHARACVVRALRVTPPHAPTVTTSPAKRRAPTRRRQPAPPCRPLHVAFQAASRGREPQGSPDPGGRGKEKGPGREFQP